VPEFAVGGLQNPVVLIRKRHKGRRNSLPLKRGEHLHSFAHGNPIVELPVDDEHRGLEILRIPVGGMPLEFLGILPRNAVIPLVEPELLRRSIHAGEVVGAGVADERPEAFRDLRLEPVDHIAAV
jgi:hypothetical protein